MNKMLTVILILFLGSGAGAQAPTAEAPAVVLKEIEQSPCFSRDGERLLQNLRVKVTNSAGGTTMTAVVDSGGEAISREVEIAAGERWINLPVREASETTGVTIELRSSGGVPARIEGVVEPQRKWTLYLTPSIHADIGYTDTQEAVFRRLNENLDDVVEMCRENPLFHWNLEVAWELQNYISARPTSATETLAGLMKEGRVGLHAGYLNELTSLLSDEAMNRVASYADDLRREHGVDISSALLTDVPTATWGFASALAGSGVRWFAQGSNQTRAPILRHSGIREPFYWEGPDGARVLMWLTESYGQSMWLAEAGKLSDIEDNVGRITRAHNRPGYPYDGIYVYGAFFDNKPVDKRYGDLLQEWNSSWAYPRLLISKTPDFFSWLEEKHGAQIPVRRGDFGAYWEDGAGSTAQETAMHMSSQRRITAAETLWSLARMSGAAAQFPKKRFEKAWENILFYAEHTWGAAQSIADPDGEMTRKQWEGKARHAHEGAADTATLLDEALTAVVSTRPAHKGDVVVMNPLSWSRSGPVALPDTVPPGATLLDENGEPVAVQMVDGHAVFHAADVPGFGSRAYRVGRNRGKVRDGRNQSMRLRNNYYDIRFDQEKGITSIVDRENGKELADPASPYSLGQLLYVSGGEDTSILMDNLPAKPRLVVNSPEQSGDPLSPPPGTLLLTPARITGIESGQSGPLFSEIVVRSQAPTMPDVQTRVRLYHQEKRIGMDVRITSKTETRRKEAVYVAFPLAVENPRFRLGMTNSISRPDKDFIPGSCSEWHCVQDFVACGAEDGGPEIIWSSADAPLVCLSQINTGRWPAAPELTTGTLFSYVMNNYWFTNYKAGQGGDFRFRYDLTSTSSPADGADCLRFARNAASPLLAAVSPGQKGGSVDPPLSLTGKGVVAGTLKPARHEQGTILRLRNAEDHTVSAAVRVGGGPAKPERVSLVEARSDGTPPGDGELNLKPQETVTLLIENPATVKR